MKKIVLAAAAFWLAASAHAGGVLESLCLPLVPPPAEMQLELPAYYPPKCCMLPQPVSRLIMSAWPEVSDLPPLIL